VNAPARVLIGPSLDLHPGIHGSLLRDPPPGYALQVREATHYFYGASQWGSTRAFSPIRRAHDAECVSLGEGGTLAHSSRWPVLGRRRWIVELDDLGYPLLFGRRGLLASFREAFARPWSEALARNILRRAQVMLGAYAHPSCRRVVFRTQAALAQAIKFTTALGLEPHMTPVIRRCTVIRPAAGAMESDAALRKWRTPGPLQVVFCGRDFAAKDGALALRVVREVLALGRALQFTCIGDVPAAVRGGHADPRMLFTGVLEPAQVQAHLRRAHVLLHTSPAESVGMVFLEAAAAGMAVIASEGPRLPHLPELLDEGGFIAVDRSAGTARAQQRAFVQALDGLAVDRPRAQAMGRANLQGARRGANSLAKRNEAWRAVYDDARAGVGGAVLAPRDMALYAGRAAARMSSARLARVIEEHLAATPGERTFHL
jgi:glycosyltransferase involved in cell wall biosynthesis